jgi:peroxiredoxin
MHIMVGARLPVVQGVQICLAISLVLPGAVAGCDRAATDQPERSVRVSASTTPAGATSAKPAVKEASAPPDAEVGKLAPGTGVAVGQRAPDVGAKDIQGKDVRLGDLLARGPVLVAFYRGGWCPYCNHEIRELTKAFGEFERRGVTPVAVSVDRPDKASVTSASYRVPFPVLSDPELSFVEGFHVAKKVEAADYEKYKGFGVDLEEYSGKAHHTITVPSLFLVDRDGVVRWAHSNLDHTVRPSIAQILAAVDAAKLLPKTTRP